jgi:hypothetical protein
MRVTKIEAAERQLDAAIRMFFADDDWLAIHTLVAASGRILRDLSQQRDTLMWNTLHSTIEPEMRKELLEALSQLGNFLKHADKDPDAVLETEATNDDKYILLNCLLFSGLGKRFTLEMEVFVLWCAWVDPEADFVPATLFTEAERLTISPMRGLPRSEQLAAGRALLESARAAAHGQTGVGGHN